MIGPRSQAVSPVLALVAPEGLIAIKALSDTGAKLQRHSQVGATHMKTWFLSALSVAALIAAPSFAQDHAQHHPAGDATAATDMSKMTPEQLHDHCKSVMGQQMAGRTPHSHATDKLGHTPPGAKPLSAAEMQKMHDKCAAVMADHKGSTSKP